MLIITRLSRPQYIPSRKRTGIPPGEVGKIIDSNMPYTGDMLIPWRVIYICPEIQRLFWEIGFLQRCFFEVGNIDHPKLGTIKFHSLWLQGYIYIYTHLENVSQNPQIPTSWRSYLKVYILPVPNVLARCAPMFPSLVMRITWVSTRIRLTESFRLRLVSPLSRVIPLPNGFFHGL